MVLQNRLQVEQTTSSRKAACRLVGKVASRLDPQTVRQEVLPVALALCQDAEFQVRLCMCCHLGFVAGGVGPEAVEAVILPQLIDLGNDENCLVRLAAVEAVVQLLPLLCSDSVSRTAVPLAMKTLDRARSQQDETLPKLSHLGSI
jgi:serine/threonine-protein phosphatase 4 regulatory subunit 4